MKLLDIVLLSLGVGFTIIGIHQMMTLGFANGYWAVMVALIFYFALVLRKKK